VQMHVPIISVAPLRWAQEASTYCAREDQVLGLLGRLSTRVSREKG